MFISNHTMVLLGLLLPAMVIADSPNLGQPATTAEIAAWDIDIAPDGTNLPEGQGTVAAGDQIYQQQCANCHGPDGIGGSAEELAGAEEPLDSEWPDKTIGSYWPYASTLFDFNRRSMPMHAPGSLSNNEVYAITAYLLHLNGLLAADEVLNADRLRTIMMPNRNGFIRFYPE